jgi:hypothetical protein
MHLRQSLRSLVIKACFIVAYDLEATANAVSCRFTEMVSDNNIVKGFIISLLGHGKLRV